MSNKGGFSIKAKKTPFPLAKEKEEEKRRQDEAAAAAVYAEFAASFASTDDVPGGKAFVRGGVVEPGSRPTSDPTATGARARPAANRAGSANGAGSRE